MPLAFLAFIFAHHLAKAVKEQSERMAALPGQSEKAYTQVQEIAVRAIEGSANTKHLADLAAALHLHQQREAR